MAPKIQTPVENFTGTVAGVGFVKGQGETDDPIALAYFERRGYTIENNGDQVVEIPEGEPTDKWTGKQLKAYAEREGIDLGAAKKNAEMLATITSAKQSTTTPPEATGQGNPGAQQ